MSHLCSIYCALNNAPSAGSPSYGYLRSHSLDLHCLAICHGFFRPLTIAAGQMLTRFEGHRNSTSLTDKKQDSQGRRCQTHYRLRESIWSPCSGIVAILFRNHRLFAGLKNCGANQTTTRPWIRMHNDQVSAGCRQKCITENWSGPATPKHDYVMQPRSELLAAGREAKNPRQLGGL